MIIVKVGGGTTINWENLALDLAKQIKKESLIIVHGASETRDQIALKLKCPTKTITSPSGVSSVYTDQAALDIFLMTYPGLVNQKIVAILQASGIKAVGLSGVDGALWRAKHKPNTLSQEGKRTKLITNNLTGRVEKINTHLLKLLLKNGYTPVISAPALSFENQIVNTDNDWAVAVMASALKVKKIIYLFEAPGLLKNLNDPKSIIKKIHSNKISDYLHFAQGRMKKKLLGAQKALIQGVDLVYLADGRVPKPVTQALKGHCTIITASK